MSILVKIVATVLLLFFVSTSPSTADIISTKIRSHNRDIILFSEFKYSHFGYVSILFTFRNLSPPPNSSSFNKSYNVTYPGLYSLYFANCNDLSLVTMDVRTELYNTDHDGVTKDYLSADQPQPSVRHVVYREYVLLMGVLLVMNMFYFISAAADEHDLKVTGTRHQWRVVFYISHFMRDMYLFIVIVLIGAGWCNWRPDLPGCTVIFNMTVVILLEVWATVTFVRVGESGPYNKNWQDFRDSFMVIDIMCCFFVYLHTIISFLMFRDAEDTSDFVRSFTSLTEVTSMHQVFPTLLLVYMMIARGLSLVFIPTVIHETITLVFYVVMFCMYRPFVLDHEDQKCARFLDHTDTGV